MDNLPVLKEIKELETSKRDIFFDADGNVVAAEDPRAVTAYFAATGHFEELGNSQ
jgi:hypothetical protein